MAFLHQDPRGRSPYWYVAYRDGNGVRAFKSTRESDWHRAKCIADALERIADEERRPDTSKQFLQRIVNDTLRRLGYETVQTPTVREWLEEWLANQHGAVSPSTLTKYTQVINQFLAFGADRKKLASISQEDIIRFRDGLLKGGRSPRTVNFLVHVLKLPFKAACAAGVIERNPVALVRSFHAKPSTKGIFTSDQISALLSVAPPEWQGLILAGFFTGGRLRRSGKAQMGVCEPCGAFCDVYARQDRL